jgi:hypothetical protein
MTAPVAQALRIFRSPLLALAVLVWMAMGPCAAAADDTANADIGLLAFTIPVPEGKLTLKQIHDAVLRGVLNREWTVKEDNETKLVAYLLHRKNEATVTFQLTEKSVEAYCLGFEVDKNGTRKKPEQPTGWLKFLKKDITKAITEAALSSGH